MNREDIIALPNTHLRRRSQKVGIITEETLKIVEGMKAATLDWEANREHEVGVALAAVQVDSLLRIVVIRNNFDDKDDKSFSVFINPVITKYEGKLIRDYEGCLSVPDVYGFVERHSEVRVKALDETGREIRITAKDFLARVFQHEIDHTNGILFVDLIKDDADAFFRLRSDGHLEKQDYEKTIKTNPILW